MADNLTPWLAGAAETGGRFAFNQWPGNGSTIRWGINFAGIAPGYLDRAHVKYYVTDDATGFSTAVFQVPSTAFISDTILELKHPVTGAIIATGQTLSVFRDSPKQQPIPNFNDGSIIDEENLDTGFRQAVYAAAEMVDRFGVSSDKADQAFTIANAANTKADTAITTANGAVTTANTALTTANNASSKADTAIATANTASATASTALSTANTAIGTANSASAAASSAVSTANAANTAAAAAVSTANSASSKADSALSTANTAAMNASTALSVANTASANASTAISTANSATTTANTAKATADTAKATADGIDAKAQSALDTANTASANASTAISTANAASTTANNIDAKAQQALDTANGVDAKAQSALDTANAADAKADQALGASDGRYDNQVRIYQNSADTQVQMLSGSRASPGSLRWSVAGGTGSTPTFALNRYNSGGTLVDAPISVNWSTGAVSTAALTAAGAVALSYANPHLTLNGTAAGQERAVVYNTNGSTRWQHGASSAAESGSNVGSDWFLSRYSDAGALIDSPLYVTRSTGKLTLTQRPAWAGYTPWDSNNFDPTTKFDKAGGAITGGVQLTTANTGFELGSTSSAGQPFIDFHSSGNNIDYDSRIIASGGTGTSGQGGLTFAANAIVLGVRPTWASGAVPWDNANFNPGTKVEKTGDQMSGRLTLGASGWQADFALQNLNGTGNANVFLRARQGGGLEVINSAYNAVPWSVDDGGTTYQSSSANIGGVRIQPDANIVGGSMPSGNLFSALSSKVPNGTQATHRAGINEFGSVNVNGAANTTDAGSPWVMIGLRTVLGSNTLFLRANWLAVG